MSISYLTQQQLIDHLNTNGSIDASVVTGVINQLKIDGIYNNTPTDPSKLAWVQEGSFTTGTLANFTQVLDITSASPGTVITTDPALKAIVVQTASPIQTYVQGSSDVYIGLGSGADSINLNDTGNDTVLGGGGNDLIGGGAGNDLIDGGAGNDSLYGGSGNNTLMGGDGNNFIRAGTGSQLLEGQGTGNNVIVDLGDSGSSTLIAGLGSDTIYGFGSDLIQGNALATGVSELHGGASSLVQSLSNTGTHNILGSGSTALTANTLQGGAGADSLYGGFGNDILTAGSGNQGLFAGQGHQSLQGGSGNDLLQDLYSGGHDTLTAGASGNDTLVGMQGDTFNSVGGAAGNNVFWVNGGGSGNSTLTGGLGNDTFHIETHTGNDTITGGGGTDSVGFGGRSITDLSGAPVGSAGNYVITFTDGQTVTTHGIADLYFGADGQVIHLP